MTLDVRPLKAEAVRSLPPGSPGREAILALDDRLSMEEFNVLLPVLLRLVLRPRDGSSE